MNFTSYFIKHPVTAIVLNAMIMIVGILCFSQLPVREYPKVDFPKISVQAQYPNASADLIETSVTNILEDSLAGVSGLKTVTSYSNQNSSRIELTFLPGYSMDRAIMAVRSAVATAKNYLPKDVKDPVVEASGKTSGPPFMALSLHSKTVDFGELTHLAKLNIANGLRSLKGVSSCEVWGQPYAYKIKLDPEKMYTFGVNANEVYEAIEGLEYPFPVGKYRNELPTTMETTLKSIEEIENVLVKPKSLDDPDHKQYPILLKSIADISLESDDSYFRVRVNGKPGLCIAVNKASDANPLDVSNLVRLQVDEFKKSLPKGVGVDVVVDQTDFIRASLKSIQSSIIEAVILVLGIVFLFIRSVRSTLIPLMTIPVSLIGSIIFLKIFGFSINTITLLAIVLAVGLVVDDAIVVLENISRHVEKGMAPLAASIKGAGEIAFAIVAMTLTLASVYAPVAFIQGELGQLFIEFAVALAGAVLISGIVALTLSPFMCSRVLKTKERHLWPQVDVVIDRLTESYGKLLRSLVLKRKSLVLSAGMGCLVLAFSLMNLLPSELAPKEDRGLIGVFIPSIQGKDLNTLMDKVLEVEQLLGPIPEAQTVITFAGDWGGNVIMPLKPIWERKRSAADIVNAIRFPMMQVPSSDAWAWSWDSGLPGIEDPGADSNNLSLIVSTVDDYKTLLNHMDILRNKSEASKLFESVGHDLKLDTLGYQVDLDEPLMAEVMLNHGQVARTIEVFFSGNRAIHFQKDGVIYAFVIEGKTTPWTLDELYVTNTIGKRISLGAVAKMRRVARPKELFHYNQMRSATLKADLLKGDKIDAMMPKLYRIAEKNVPASYKKSWAGAAKAYEDSSSTTSILFFLALVFIYAILALQFQRFIDPLIIMLTVPLACAGALLFVWALGQSVNIYTQVGLITLIGLITKHGILIVEFTNQLIQDGKDELEAVLEASILRLRPILMTTGAMVFGSLPLLFAMNCGAEARRVIGAVLVGGLTFGTLLTLFVLPTLCYLIKSLERKLEP